jgi:hypothetical protein
MGILNMTEKSFRSTETAWALAWMTVGCFFLGLQFGWKFGLGVWCIFIGIL